MLPWPKIPPESHKSQSDNLSSQLREVVGLQSRTKGEKESQAVKNLKFSKQNHNILNCGSNFSKETLLVTVL